MAQLPTSPSPQLTPEENSTWRPQPYAERKSQNLNPLDYAVRGLFRIVFGGSSGWAIGKAIDSVSHTNRYSGIGLWVGGILGSFLTWQRGEKYDQQVAALHEQFKEIPGLRRSNEELAADNAILKQMIAHQQQTLAGSQVSASSVQHDGAVNATAAEQEISA